MSIQISGITISVDIGDKEYGKGQNAFMNLQGKYPDGVSIEELEDVMEDGLDMYFAAWRTLLAGRYTSGQLTGIEFKEVLAASALRVDKIRKYLRKPVDGQQ